MDRERALKRECVSEWAYARTDRGSCLNNLMAVGFMAKSVGNNGVFEPCESDAQGPIVPAFNDMRLLDYGG